MSTELLQSKLDEIAMELRRGTTGANIHRVANLLQVVSATMQGVRVTEVLQLLPQVTNAYGELMQTIVQAVEDGVIDESECCSIARASDHVSEIIKHVADSVRARRQDCSKACPFKNINKE